MTGGPGAAAAAAATRANMDAVNAFNQELFSLMDMKPPISRAKMILITKAAIKLLSFISTLFK